MTGASRKSDDWLSLPQPCEVAAKAPDWIAIRGTRREDECMRGLQLLADLAVGIAWPVLDPNSPQVSLPPPFGSECVCRQSVARFFVNAISLASALWLCGSAAMAGVRQRHPPARFRTNLVSDSLRLRTHETLGRNCRMPLNPSSRHRKLIRGMTRRSGSPRRNGVIVPLSASVPSSRGRVPACAATAGAERAGFGAIRQWLCGRWRTARRHAYHRRRDTVLQ